jgi:CheY-like chemotaxis protein
VIVAGTDRDGPGGRRRDGHGSRRARAVGLDAALGAQACRLSESNTVKPGVSALLLVPWGSVLLVEDDSGVREATQRALRAAGYRVLSAPGAERALEVVKAGGTIPALLVTDVIMPEVSGPDLAVRMRAEFPAMRVLYLSGYAHGVIGPHGVLDPGVAFLPKPFTPRSLLARVREVLDAP